MPKKRSMSSTSSPNASANLQACPQATLLSPPEGGKVQENPYDTGSKFSGYGSNQAADDLGDSDPEPQSEKLHDLWLSSRDARTSSTAVQKDNVKVSKNSD